MEPSGKIPAGEIRSRLEHLNEVKQVDRVFSGDQFRVYLADGDSFTVQYETIRDVWHMDDETMIDQLRKRAEKGK